jgi:uncharacterized membrane protein YtjA (UPF0391 family)
VLYWAVIFLVISFVAGVCGFASVAAAAAGMAEILFFICVALFVITLAMGIALGRRISPDG